VTSDLGPSLEEPRAPTSAAFSDAVTVSFGDAEAGLYGLLRIGLGAGPHASVLALLFSGRDVAAAHAEGGVEIAEPSFAPPELGATGIETIAPLERWRARFTDEGGGGFDLDVEALSPPLRIDVGAADLEAYEQLCQINGIVRVAGAERRVECLGQRGHAWGEPDWDRISLTRSLSAWLDENTAITLSAVRPAGASSHDEEAVSAVLVEPVEDRVLAHYLADPRLSTTYDRDGRQRRASLELWESDDADYPRRASGSLVCGTSLELGRLRLDCAFFEWHMEGRAGVGRYDVLKRA
jgi:hypothetical protein